MSIQPWWCCCNDVPCDQQTLCDELRRRLLEDPILTPAERDAAIAEINRLCGGDFAGVDQVALDVFESDNQFACPCSSVVLGVRRRVRSSSYALFIAYDDGRSPIDITGGETVEEQFDCATGAVTNTITTPRTLGTNPGCTSPSPFVQTNSRPLTCNDDGLESKFVAFTCDNDGACPCSGLSTIPSDGYDPCFDEVEAPGGASSMTSLPGGRLGQLLGGRL